MGSFLVWRRLAWLTCPGNVAARSHHNVHAADGVGGLRHDEGELLGSLDGTHSGEGAVGSYHRAPGSERCSAHRWRQRLSDGTEAVAQNQGSSGMPENGGQQQGDGSGDPRRLVRSSLSQHGAGIGGRNRARARGIGEIFPCPPGHGSAR
jgi:hypothetical protein